MEISIDSKLLYDQFLPNYWLKMIFLSSVLNQYIKISLRVSMDILMYKNDVFLFCPRTTIVDAKCLDVARLKKRYKRLRTICLL